MFTPEEIESIPLYLEQLFRTLQLNVMTDIVERLVTNSKEIIPATDYQLNRLYELGASKTFLQNKVQDTLEKSDEEIEKIFSDIIESGYARNKTLYEKTGKDFITYSENKPLQQLVNAVKKQTADECKNITQSMGFAVEQPDGTLKFKPIADYYQKTLDNAAMQILTGTSDFDTVLKKAVNEMTNSGLRTVDYASGWSNRVDVAARRALLTGFNQVVEKVNEDNAEQLETEHFEVSWHRGARPTHQVWQGRVYSKAELVSVCGLGTVTGLCGANCYHSYSPFILGVSERLYTDEQLDKMNTEENTLKEYNGKKYTTYEALQRQRRLESTMRAQRQKIKLLENGEAKEETILAAKARYVRSQDEYVNFSKSMNLPEEWDRVTIENSINSENKFTTKIRNSVANSGESGIINIKEYSEREELPRKDGKGDFSVKWSTVQSEKYSSKFSKLSDNEKVVSSIRTRAKWALNNREGMDTEEIYAVNMTTGKEVAKIINQQYNKGVKRTPLFTKKLNEADDKGEKILLLHNHPEGLPPSISDINALLDNKNVAGITVGHDGSVYYYTRPKVPINEIDYNVKLRHYKNLAEVECIEAALSDLQEKFGFTVEKL